MQKPLIETKNKPRNKYWKNPNADELNNVKSPAKRLLNSTKAKTSDNKATTTKKKYETIRPTNFINYLQRSNPYFLR